VQIKRGAPFIDHCTIRDCNEHGIYVVRLHAAHVRAARTRTTDAPPPDPSLPSETRGWHGWRYE